MMSDKLIKVVAIVMLIATIISFIGMLVFI